MTNFQFNSDFVIVTNTLTISSPPTPFFAHPQQTFKATPTEIEKFLKKFFGTTEFIEALGHDQPINKGFADNDSLLTSVAKDLSTCFMQPDQLDITVFSDPIYFDNHIVLKTGKVDSSEIPDNAVVTSAGSNSLRLFGPAQNSPTGELWTWKHLKKRIQKSPDKKWIEELGEAMKSAREGFLLDPIKGLFQSQYTGKNYSVTLLSLRTSSGNLKEYEFRISFSEQPIKGVLSTANDVRHTTLLSCLTLGYRLNWEICDHFQRELNRWNPQKDDSGQEIYSRIQDTMSTIQKEAEARRQIQGSDTSVQDRLIFTFDQNDDRRSEVRENLKEQRLCKEEISREISQRDTHGIGEQLKKLQKLNNQLMIVVAERYGEVLNEVNSKKDEQQ